MGRDIARYGLGFTDDWHAVPMQRHVGGPWADGLVAELLPADSPAVQLLSYQLSHVQQNLSEMDVAEMISWVWVPQPDSGYIGCILGYRLSDIAPEDSLERVLADLEADRERVIDGSRFREVETWRGKIPAGEFVAARNLVEHPEDETGEISLEERTVFAVFPTDSNQAIQMFFSAESIGSFWDMPTQTQQLVATLSVELEDAA